MASNQIETIWNSEDDDTLVYVFCLICISRAVVGKPKWNVHCKMQQTIVENKSDNNIDNEEADKEDMEQEFFAMTNGK